MTLQMLDFCDDSRRYDKPFIEGGYEYATDGKVAVRRKIDAPDSSEIPIKNIGKIVFEDSYPLDPNAEPIDIPPFVDCEKCKNKAFTYTKSECDECLGEGESECNECGCVSACRECEGSGKVDTRVDCESCKERYCFDINCECELAENIGIKLARNGVKQVLRCVDIKAVRFHLVDEGGEYEGVVMLRCRDDR